MVGKKGKYENKITKSESGPQQDFCVSFFSLRFTDCVPLNSNLVGGRSCDQPTINTRWMQAGVHRGGGTALDVRRKETTYNINVELKRGLSWRVRGPHNLDGRVSRVLWSTMHKLYIFKGHMLFISKCCAIVTSPFKSKCFVCSPIPSNHFKIIHKILYSSRLMHYYLDIIHVIWYEKISSH